MKKITLSELAYAIMMAVACAASYPVTSRVIGPFIDRGDSLLGGMWAAVATAFVFRETRVGSLAAGVSRLVATCVSFALCSIYIALLPVNAGGIVLLIGAGAIVMQSFRRPEDIITTSITSIVLMGVAAIDPEHAFEQPVLRLFDTVTGIGIGVPLRWGISCAMARPGIVPGSKEGIISSAERKISVRRSSF
ncbi:FUSC family protein [Bradyrhizobium canariense]|uniref:FUSC family protein n=1 Tax=Bradyrhizobium canariense TaxID=255045 RepID=UPI000A197253|nr:FUSC family protein [Bradyrhizobium canariense]OSI23793.1 hypothetical protein BST65_21080 [Bradyrhizobium canariense]OSI30950.1 hypothetical protein BST66_20765 [Bradyrhizobium canariense]OSI39854.1 hypothetical protein BSZ20_28315 [Bradyrhizobium canariense]OSI48144.1 hypothetical protein BST67_18795 [Bradyrhizobium canariense]OSI50029.1 hypothetical protein BSZ15_33650 [Bradyrhizobium canariense]